jgi:hypothetical protein
VYKFVAIRVQAPTYAVTPAPISTIVILPTVELPGMVGRHRDVALIYKISIVTHQFDKLDLLTRFTTLSEDLSHPRSS